MRLALLNCIRRPASVAILLALAPISPAVAAEQPQFDGAPRSTLEGTGYGCWIAPGPLPGFVHGELFDQSGVTRYQIEGRIYEWAAGNTPRTQVGGLEGILREVGTYEVVGTFQGAWRAMGRHGLFVCEIQPAGRPRDAHVGVLRGWFTLPEHSLAAAPDAQSVSATDEPSLASAPSLAALPRPWLARAPSLASNPDAGGNSRGHSLASAPSLAAQPSLASNRDGDVDSGGPSLASAPSLAARPSFASNRDGDVDSGGPSLASAPSLAAQPSLASNPVGLGIAGIVIDEVIGVQVPAQVGTLRMYWELYEEL